MIDHIITNDDPIDFETHQNVQSFSDHNMIFLPLVFKKKKTIIDKCKRTFSNQNIEFFKTLLYNETWQKVYQQIDVEKAVENFDKIFFDYYNKAFPLRQQKIDYRKKPLNEFMTKDLLNLRRKKMRLYGIYQSSKNFDDKIAFINCRNKYNHSVRKAKKHYYTNLLNKQKNQPKKMWETLKEISGLGTKSREGLKVEEIKVGGEKFTNKQDIADKFNFYFTSIGKEKANLLPESKKDFKSFLPPSNPNSFVLLPTDPIEVLEILESLTNKSSKDANGISGSLLKSVATEIAPVLSFVYNLSFEKGHFPQSWKTSRTIPIFKKGAKDDMSNYRPIGLINELSIVDEKIVHRRLLSFLESINFFSHNQFGFLPNRNVMQAITKLLNYINMGLNEGLSILLVMLDISKCYDCIDVDILLKKLENLGVRGIELLWFETYLKGRKQKVDINGTFSKSTCSLEVGLTQGSSLSCLLFIIFINDLFTSTQLFSIAFADDTNFALKGDNINEMALKLNRELKKVLDWYISNKLTLNYDKCNVMLFSNNKTLFEALPDIYFDMNNDNEFDHDKLHVIKKVKRDQSVRFLGFWIDSDLSFEEHFRMIYRKLSFAIYALKRVKNFISNDAMKLLYYAFFHSHLEFSSTFLLGTTNKNINKIITIQKQAIRTLIGLPRKSHTAEAFSVLDILPFNCLMTYNVLKFMLKFETRQLSATFDSDYYRNREINTRTLRNADDYHIPFTRTKKIEQMPPYVFSKIRNDNVKFLPFHHFGEKYLDELKENLLDDYVLKNICKNSKNCYICKKLNSEKDVRLIKKVERLKKVERIIRQRGLKKKERIKKMLEKTTISIS